MLKTAEMLANKLKCAALLTGDNLGQVATQTLSNLFVEDSFVSIPVLRPLIGFDKDEITKIAKKIGTFYISTKSDEGCGISPKNPITKAKKEKIREFDVKDLMNAIVQIPIKG